MNPILTKSFKAEAAVVASVFVKYGTADNQVVTAAAATDSIIGVSEQIDSAINEQCDVIQLGIAYVKFGGTVVRGGPVTSDASGFAVAAAPGAGTNNRIAGYAQVSAVSGDIAPVLVIPQQIQG